MIILSILAMTAIFSLLVIAHEFGHFKAARRENVDVEEFGIGFPPKLFGRKKGKTLFSVNALPIGGFVKLKGEDGITTGKGSFADASYWQKTKIIMAGVAVNFLIAYILFTILLIAGIPQLGQSLPKFGPIQPSEKTTTELTVFTVNNNSAASKAGIKKGDKIISINNQTFENNNTLREFTNNNLGKSVTIEFISSGEKMQKTIVLGTDSSSGILGITADKISYNYYSWWSAPIAALILMIQLIIATLAAFGNLLVGIFTKAQVSEQVSGPVGVWSVFSQITSFGWRYIVLFVASISLSLAVINALPLPALDGGRQLMLILKKVGFKITPQKENLVHVLGFVFLIGLMIIISISDISKLR